MVGKKAQIREMCVQKDNCLSSDSPLGSIISAPLGRVSQKLVRNARVRTALTAMLLDTTISEAKQDQSVEGEQAGNGRTRLIGDVSQE